MSPFLANSKNAITGTSDPTRIGSHLAQRASWDPHVRSAEDANGDHAVSIDGEIGHIDEFPIDYETWAIRYLMIDTKSCWTGKKVLVAPYARFRIAAPRARSARRVLDRSVGN